MATRTLYVGQQAKINTTLGNTYLPVISASCEVSRPIQFLTSFGHMKNIGAAQSDFTTCKGTLKAYLMSGSGITSDFISALTGDAVQGRNSVVTVSPYGFTMSGIISNVGVELAIGAFGTTTLTFDGIGEPFFDSGNPSSALPATQPNMPKGFIPVVQSMARDSLLSGCSNSFKFNFDIPNDKIACLGDNVTGTQTQITSKILPKFPFKTSISVEGYGIDISKDESALNLIKTGFYTIGDFTVRLPNPKVTSKSVNQAVGQVGASYNYVLEDVVALFPFGTFAPFFFSADPTASVGDGNNAEWAEPNGTTPQNVYSNTIPAYKKVRATFNYGYDAISYQMQFSIQSYRTSDNTPISDFSSSGPFVDSSTSPASIVISYTSTQDQYLVFTPIFSDANSVGNVSINIS